MDVPEKSLEVAYILEPELSFAHGQTSDHPKDGLFLYGPHSAPARSREVSIAVIGTKDGLSYFRNWAIRLGGFIAVPPPGKMDKEHRLHLSNFPGLEEAFSLIISPGEFVERTIDLKELDDATKTLNQHEAVRKAVDLYIKEIEHHDENEERTVDVWIFILPELVFERCKPLSRRSGLELVKGEFIKKQKARSDLPLFEEVIDQSDEEIFDDVPDFHRQVKARLLKLGHTSQLIRETRGQPRAHPTQGPTQVLGQQLCQSPAVLPQGFYVPHPTHPGPSFAYPPLARFLHSTRLARFFPVSVYC